MAWPAGTRSFKDAAATTRQAIIDRTATAGEDVPIYKPAFGADQADPTVVVRTAGLPVVGQRTAGIPLTAKIANATASVTTTGNQLAVGGTGGSAVPGVFVVTADPDNVGLIVLGDTNISAAQGSGSTRYVRGLVLQPGQSVTVDTDDLRSWKFAVRNANDGLTWLQLAS